MTKPIRILLVLSVLILGIFFEYKVINIFLGDMYLKKSRLYLENGNPEESLVYIEKAIDKVPNEPYYLINRARVYITLSVGENKESIKALKDLALSDLQKAYNLNLNNLRTTRNSIPLYYFLAINDYLEPSSTDNIDTNFIDTTKDFYAKTKQRYENDAGVLVSIAKYEKKLGLEKEYLESIGRIKILRSDLLDWNEDLK